MTVSSFLTLTCQPQQLQMEPKPVGFSLTLTRHSQLYQVELTVGLSLTHVPPSATSSGTESSGLISLPHTPLSYIRWN